MPEPLPNATPSSSLPGWLRAVLNRFRRPRRADLLMQMALALVIFGVAAVAMLFMATAAQAMPLSAGDRIQVVIEAGEEFSGKYQLDVAGRIELPIAGSVQLGGLESDVAAQAISARLVAAGLFKKSFVRTTLQVLLWAPLDVRVSGAVFNPGAHRVNMPATGNRAYDRGEDLPGAYLPERRLSDALRAAGGITPWADLAHVAIRRRGLTHLYNLWGVMLGERGDDPALQSGDEVMVPLTAAPNAMLSRPSSITPPGIRIYVSNLISPALSNTAATASNGAMSFGYGARFSQAVVAANCVGGTVTSNSQRAAVMVRTDRLTGATRNWDSPVETLIRAGNEEINPTLQEGDAVACYDSRMVGVRDVVRMIYEVLLPISVLRHLP